MYKQLLIILSIIVLVVGSLIIFWFPVESKTKAKFLTVTSKVLLDKPVKYKYTLSDSSKHFSNVNLPIGSVIVCCDKFNIVGVHLGRINYETQ